MSLARVSHMDLILQITIISIAAGTIALAILIPRIARDLRARKEHLEKLKKHCLEPLLQGSGVIVLGEPSSLPDIERFFKIPGTEDLDPTWIQCPSQPDWHRSFSLARLCPKHLYRDLENHWPDLYRKLEEIERLVRETYPRFAELKCGILEKIRTLLSNKIEAEIQSPEQRERWGEDIGARYREAVENEALITWASLLKALGERIEERGWINNAKEEWYKKLSIFHQDIESIAGQVSRENRGDIEELKRIEARARQTVREAIDLLARATGSKRLGGRCRYRDWEG